MRGQTARLARGCRPVASPPMLRKAIMPDSDPRRRFRITLRLSATEFDELKAGAAGRNLCLSAFARTKLVGARLTKSARRPAQRNVLLASILGRIGAIADALKMIGVRLEADGALPSIQRDVLHVLGDLRRVNSELVQTLRRGSGQA